MISKTRRCPVCGKPETEEQKPFCSKRCAEIDLGRWLSEAYALPTNPQAAEENDGDPEL